MKYRVIGLSPNDNNKTFKTINRMYDLLGKFDDSECITRTELVDGMCHSKLAENFTMGELKHLLDLRGVTVVENFTETDYRQQGARYI